MKHFDAFMVNIDKRQIVQLLQNKVAWIVKNIGTRVVVNLRQKPFERYSIVEVFTWVYLVTTIHTVLVEHVKNGTPATRQLLKSFVDDSCRTLWPWIDHWPKKRTRKRNVRSKSQVMTRLRREFDLIDGPVRSGRRIAVNRLWRKPIKQDVVCWMDSDQLTFEMGRQFSNFNALRLHDPI